MLTYHQAETVAYMTDGEFICRDCLVKAEGSVAVEQLDLGIGRLAGGDISPLCRYSMDEYDGERTYEAAQERADDFEREHPALYAALVQGNDSYRLIDRLADKLGDMYAERCGDCGEKLA